MTRSLSLPSLIPVLLRAHAHVAQRSSPYFAAHRCLSVYNLSRDSDVACPSLKRPLRSIRTLDPTKLSAEDYLDLAGRIRSDIRAILPDFRPARRSMPLPRPSIANPIIQLYFHRPRSRGSSTNINPESDPEPKARRKYRRLPFPHDARGFLYYHRTAAEIRFRYVPEAPSPSEDDTHVSIRDLFDAGADLELAHPDVRWPWFIAPQLRLGGRAAASAEGVHPASDSIVSLLIHDKFWRPNAPPPMTPSGVVRYQGFRTVLSSLNQPFRINIGLRESEPVHVRHADGSTGPPVCLTTLFGDRKSFTSTTMVYSGIITCRFERITVTELEHEHGLKRDPSDQRETKSERRLLAIRVLDIVEPIRCKFPAYDGYVPMPRVGEFIQRPLPGCWTVNSRPWAPWTIDVDEPQSQFRPESRRDLALLW